MNQALILSHTLGEAGDITEETLRGNHFLASVRLQLLPAIKGCLSNGLQPRVLALRSERPGDLDNIEQAKICLIGKLSHPQQDVQQRIALANIAAVARLKRRGVPIVLIYSDNIAEGDGSSRSEMACDLIEYADLLVFPCKALEAITMDTKRSDKKRAVIEDPWQVSEHPFAIGFPGNETRFIWFGHGSNARYLLEVLEEVLSADIIGEKKVFTALSDGNTLRAIKEKIKALRLRTPWKVRLVEWLPHKQPEQLDRELAWSHIAIIPSDTSDPKKCGVSHNRAVDAVRAGCITLASNLQSYRELAPCLLIGDSFSEMIGRVNEDYAAIARRLQTNRGRVLERFSPEANILAWRNLILKLTSSQIAKCIGKDGALQSD